MRRTFIAATILVSFLPVAALAYFSKASDVLMSIKLQNQPMDFSGTINESYQDTTAVVSMKGSVEGKTADTLKMNLAITLNSAWKGKTVKAVGEIRILNKIAYVELKDLRGSMIDAKTAAQFSQFEGKWYSSPINSETLKNSYAPSASFTNSFTNSAPLTPDQQKQIFLQMVDAMLSVTRSQTSGGSSYSIQLKPDAVNALLQTVRKIARDMHLNSVIENLSQQKEQVTNLRLFFSKVNFHIVVTTDPQDQFLRGKSYVGVTITPEDFNGMGPGSFVFQGDSSVRSLPISVSVPANAIDFLKIMGFPVPSSQGTGYCNRSLCGSRPPRASR